MGSSSMRSFDWCIVTRAARLPIPSNPPVMEFPQLCGKVVSRGVTLTPPCAHTQSVEVAVAQRSEKRAGLWSQPWCHRYRIYLEHFAISDRFREKVVMLPRPCVGAHHCIKRVVSRSRCARGCGTGTTAPRSRVQQRTDDSMRCTAGPWHPIDPGPARTGL